MTVPVGVSPDLVRRLYQVLYYVSSGMESWTTTEVLADLVRVCAGEEPRLVPTPVEGGNDHTLTEEGLQGLVQEIEAHLQSRGDTPGVSHVVVKKASPTI